jgi:hypothetical protein
MISAIVLQVQRNKLIRAARALVCVLAAGHLLFASALAASPELHKRVHQDADSAGHDCFVTLLSHGQIISGDAVVALVTGAVLLLFLTSVVPPLPFGRLDLLLPAGRAPPLV